MVVCTPPPVDEPRRLHLTTKMKGMPAALLDRSTARTEQYVRAAAEVAAEMGVVVADLHSGLRGHGGADWAERLLSDGLHLTEAGQERVYNIIEAAVRNWKKEEGGADIRKQLGDDTDTGKQLGGGAGKDRIGVGIGGSSLRAHSAMLPWEAPTHSELVGGNSTDEWNPPG